MNVLLAMFLGSVMVACAVFDIKSQRIPNLITYPSMLISLSYHGISNGWQGLAFSGTGLLLGMALFFIPYFLGGMGAGDVKLMGVAGAFLGVRGVLIAALLTALVGGIYAVILLILKPSFSHGFIHLKVLALKTYLRTGQFIPITKSDEEKKPKLCYGVAIALGTLIYLLLETTGYKILS